MFDATNKIKNIDKSKQVYSGYLIEECLPDTDNRKNKLLVLGEGPIDNIKASFRTAKKVLSINLSKQR